MAKNPGGRAERQAAEGIVDTRAGRRTLSRTWLRLILGELILGDLILGQRVERDQ